MNKDLTYKIFEREYGGAQVLEDVKLLRDRADRLILRKKILESGIEYGRDIFKEIPEKERFLKDVLNYQTGQNSRIKTKNQIGQVFLERLIYAFKPEEDQKYILQVEEAQKRISAYGLRLLLENTAEDIAERREAETEMLRRTQPDQTAQNHREAIRN